MNLSKIGNFMDLTNLPSIHIIGTGAIGSWIAMQLVRQGVTNLTIWDDDSVESKNLTNQFYYASHLGTPKVLALKDSLLHINPKVSITTHNKRYTNEPLTGYVFLCVDSIETRKAIATQNQYNPMIKAMFDCRMGLTDAQHYAADWSQAKHKERFIASMNFKDSEVQITSACGTTLSVLPTVLNITQAAVANFMNHTRNEPIKNEVHIDSFIHTTNYY